MEACDMEFFNSLGKMLFTVYETTQKTLAMGWLHFSCNNNVDNFVHHQYSESTTATTTTITNMIQRCPKKEGEKDMMNQSIFPGFLNRKCNSMWCIGKIRHIILSIWVIMLQRGLPQAISQGFDFRQFEQQCYFDFMKIQTSAWETLVDKSGIS